MRSNRPFLTLVFVALAMAALGLPVRADSRWATLDGHKIHFYDQGKTKEKNAVVLIHGWTCNADFWKDNVKGLSDFRVLAIDLPGHGQSDKPKLNYSMEHFARAIDAVLKSAGVERAVLVGHSMGTPVARQYYRLYPSKTAGIVVVDGALVQMFPKSQLETFFAPLRANYKENAAKFVDGMLTPIKDEVLKKKIRDSMLSTPDYVGISAMDGMYDDRIWTNDKINVPVLAVMAPSPFWPKDLREKYLEVAPSLDFQMWNNVSHFLQMERPDEFSHVVKEFVKKKKLL